MKLNKRIFREVKENFNKYIGLFLLNVISVMVIVGYCSFADSAVKTIGDFKDNNNLEDGNITLYKEMDDDLLSDIYDLGIQLEAEFYTDYELENNHVVRVFAEREKINTIEIVEGTGLNDSFDILLDQNFAKHNEININDKLTIDGKTFNVCGFATSPDYVMVTQSLKDVVPNHEQFGIAFVSKSTFQDMSNEKINYSYAYKYMDDSLDEISQKELFDEAKELIADSNYLVDVYKTDNNARANYCQEKMTLNKNMVIMICVVLIILMSYITAVSVSSMIEQDSKIIGTLYAMGYNKKEMVSHYIRIPFLLAVCSSIIGGILGITVICKIVAKTPMSFFNFPIMDIKMSVGMFVFGLLSPIIIVVILNEILISKKLLCSVLSLLRSEKKAGKIHQVALNKFKFTTKFKIRNFVESLGNYIILAIALLLVVILLIFGLGMKYSLEKYPDDISNSIKNEYTYYLKYTYELEEDNTAKAVDISCVWNEEYNITLRGIDEACMYYDMNIGNDENSCIISSAVAKKFGLKKGMNISLKNNGDYSIYEFVIDEIYDYNDGLYVFTNRANLNELADNDADYFNVVLSDHKLDIPNEYIYAELTKKDIVDASDTIVSMLKAMIVMLLGAAVIVSVVSIYILVKIILDKEKSHISLIKILGYQDQEINLIYLNSTFMVVLLSLVIAIPVGNFVLQRLWLKTIASIQAYIEFNLEYEAYGIIVLTVIGTYLISNFLLKKHAAKISMTEALKTRE